MMLKSTIKNGIYKLQIDRPAARNALDRELREALAKAIGSPPDFAKVIAITGTKDAFCSGQDLNEFNENSDVAAIMRYEYQPILQAIEKSELPVIAGVEGACAGAGVSLALACDLILASDTAFFQIAFGRIALVPDILLTYQLPRVVGSTRAMGMALTGDRIGADEALEWGVIWRKYYAADFDQLFDEFCERLAQGSKGATGMTRQLLRKTWQNSPHAQFELETEFQKQAAESADFREGVDAFLQKRSPQFSEG